MTFYSSSNVFELLLHTRAVNACISKRNKMQRGNISTKFIAKLCFLCALGTKKKILNLEESANVLQLDLVLHPTYVQTVMQK